MDSISYVVVFPNIFSKNKIPTLITNIKKILKIKNQKFRSVKRDGDIILVDSNDPVFASSAINLLFGIEKVSIAKCVKNNFNEIVSEITSVGGNLILKGEKFLVRVEGVSKGFLTKDVEIAATSSIIEKKSKLGAYPGTEKNHDKLLHTYLTTKNAYISIFSDKGNGGIPYQVQKQKTICAVYDELSAISCYETIKQGYDTKIIICYRKKSELMNLTKIVNQIIPRVLEEKIELEFIHLNMNSNGIRNYLTYVNSIIRVLIQDSRDYVSLALSPLVFSSNFISNALKQVFESKKIPILPLSGIDDNMFSDAKELGIDKNFKKLEKIINKLNEVPLVSEKQVKSILKTRKKILINLGPNNVHDILDSLGEKH